MTAFLVANLAPIMFGSLIVFLLFGYPVAFSLAACGLFFGFVGIELGTINPAFLQSLPLRMFGIMQNDTLLAIPFFTFMGLILERSGMAEDLLDTIGQLFGPIRGGLAYAVILVGAMLAATTGVVAASVISMGLISLPIMLRYGYDRRVASGVIAASGTLAQIIPPSLVLIILADQLGKSVGDLYAGAFVPGFVLTGLYVGYILMVSLIKPTFVPALPAEARTIREDDGTSGLRSLGILTVLSVIAAVAFAKTRPEGTPLDEKIVVSMCVGVGVAFFAAVLNKATKLGLLSRMAERVTFVLIPPLGLIFLVLGTIFLGIATPTEGGAMGAMGALVMAIARRRIDFKLLRQAMDSTMKLSCFVLFILVGATVFSLAFQGRGRPGLGGTSADRPARRTAGFPDRREHSGVPAGLFPGLLRAGLHHCPAGRPRGREDGHRPGVVRRSAGGEHADVVHASAVWLCPVLPAQRGAGGRLHRQGHQETHQEGHNRADLLGLGALRADPDHHGWPDHRFPGHRLHKHHQGPDHRCGQGSDADGESTQGGPCAGRSGR
jgi:TRAP-type mannitol/chloroaromatic compound transport system permease large subunit